MTTSHISHSHYIIDGEYKKADWLRGFLPLLALIIWSTISAAPRSWSLACWYSIFCFSISFSCVKTNNTVSDIPEYSSQIKWNAQQLHLKCFLFSFLVFLFFTFSTALREKIDWQTCRIFLNSKQLTQSNVENEVPLPSYLHMQYTRDLPPKN